jgi:hypothetical protein
MFPYVLLTQMPPPDLNVFVSAETDRLLHLNVAELMLKMKAWKRRQRVVHAVSYRAGGLTGCLPMAEADIGATWRPGSGQVALLG